MDEARARELLQSERAEVASLLEQADAASATDLEPDGPGDYGDSALPLEEAEDTAVGDDLRDRLHAIDRALARINAGTYGHSVLSGAPIPDDRLEADPAAELTIEETRARR
jgi:DnaK suppressor protein